jgi:hypothetical protein
MGAPFAAISATLARALDIYSLCPLRVGTLLWEAQPEQLTLTVTVKATLTLVHGGEATLAPEQDPIGDERHWDNNALASLQRPGDNAPLKPKVDILLTGHAHAPGAVPTSSLAVRLRVGELVKSLRVNGDRTFSDEGGRLAPTEPAPFTRMPLRYERALLSADNPVGIDSARPADRRRARLPQHRARGPRGHRGLRPRRAHLARAPQAPRRRLALLGLRPRRRGPRLGRPRAARLQLRLLQHRAQGPTARSAPRRSADRARPPPPGAPAARDAPPRAAPSGLPRASAHRPRRRDRAPL